MKLYNQVTSNSNAGRGLQSRSKRLDASIAFETLRTGLQTQSRLGLN